MFIEIDTSGDLPIYAQIVRQVKFVIASRAVRANELMPSVRDLARELAINPNTVARSYRSLQDQGLLALRRGTGLAVTEEAFQRCHDQRIELVRLRLRQSLDEAIQSRLEESEIRKLIDEELSSLISSNNSTTQTEAVQ